VKTRLWLLVLLLAGCATNTGVIPIGGDTYQVTRQAQTDFASGGSVKAEALQEAYQYCEARHKDIMVTHSKEAHPPYLFGNTPKAEIQFKCVDPAK
jgi:hypothetical protein